MTYISVFLEVVHSQSFTKAAEKLGVTRPLVSKRIKEMEELLGTRLINRTTRSFHLTEAGEILYERCLETAKNLESAELEISNLTNKPSGRVKISSPINFGQMILNDILINIQQQHPKLKFTVDLCDDISSLVESGYDLAIRVGRLTDSNMIARKICDMRILVCASPQYLADHGQPEVPEDCKKHNCLVASFLKRGDAVWTFYFEGQDYSVHVGGDVEANNLSPLTAFAKAGRGLLYAPEYMIANELATGELVAILEDYQPRNFGVYAIYPHAHPAPKIRVIVEALMAAVKPISTANET